MNIYLMYFIYKKHYIYRHFKLKSITILKRHNKFRETNTLLYLMKKNRNKKLINDDK